MKRSHLQSQHFIRRPQLVKTLVGHSNLKQADIVYDIGAGSGVITSVLAQTCKHVIAVEFDKGMAAKLRDNTAQLANVEVISGDFLKLTLPDTAYKIFANIPFHLSSPILRKLAEAPNQPTATYLVVQKQFAKKLIVGEASAFTGLLGTMITPWFTTRIRYKLERTDFWPHPAVDTVMIEILRRETPLLERAQQQTYNQFVEQCYARQKYFATLPAQFTKGKRPSQLTADEWVALYRSSKSA